MNAAAPLHVDNLSCIRSQRLLFNRLSFTVSAGQALLLTGPNGSGKSSLLRVLAGLLPAAEGRVLWRGSDTQDEPDALRRDLVFIGHAEAIKPTLTLAENLGFWAALHGTSASRETTGRSLRQVGLDSLADQPARYLSAGQRRRLSLARAVVLARPLWLLDEPLTALDEAGQAMATGLLSAHLQTGGVAVIATHQLLAVPQTRTLALGGSGLIAA